MLDHAAETDGTRRPDLSQLFERLMRDGKRWAEAEMTMARLDVEEFKNQAARAAIFIGIGLAASLCLLVVMTQAAIAFLSPHVGGSGVAALIVALPLLGLLAISIAGLRSALSLNTESVLFGWLARRPRSASRGS